MSNSDVLTEKYKGHTIRIVVDECAQNPFEAFDGEGKIHSFSNRHNNHIPREEGEEILRANKYAVPLGYFEHGNCMWFVNGEPPSGTEGDFQWDGVSFAGVWEPDQDCIDNILAKALEQIPKAKIKTVECASVGMKPEHNRPWNLEVAGKHFDNFKDATTYGVSIAKRNRKWKDILLGATREYARSVCKLYTSYCNGEVYGYTVEGPLCHDSCFGYYGETDYPIQEAKSAIDYAHKQAAKEARKNRQTEREAKAFENTQFAL